jgi:hypothetical protein
VARSSDAAAYLAGVRHSTLLDLRGAPGNATPEYGNSPGGAPDVLPPQSDIWVASARGAGQQQLTWDPQQGDWTVVLMNADGSPGVAADVSVGATVPALRGVMVGLFVAGGLLLVLSIAMVLIALNTGRRASASGSPPPGAAGPGATTGATTNPERPQA